MAKFNLYTYQFRPVNKEETLFEKTPLPVEERMEKKQDIFNALFDKTSGFVFKYGINGLNMRSSIMRIES